jgi:hypothetical protein
MNQEWEAKLKRADDGLALSTSRVAAVEAKLAAAEALVQTKVGLRAPTVRPWTDTWTHQSAARQDATSTTTP